MVAWSLITLLTFLSIWFYGFDVFPFFVIFDLLLHLFQGLVLLYLFFEIWLNLESILQQLYEQKGNNFLDLVVLEQKIYNTFDSQHSRSCRSIVEGFSFGSRNYLKLCQCLKYHYYECSSSDQVINQTILLRQLHDSLLLIYMLKMFSASLNYNYRTKHN